MARERGGKRVDGERFGRVREREEGERGGSEREEGEIDC